MTSIAESSYGSSGFSIERAPVLLESHHTFQTPVRFEECRVCHESVSPSEFARHLYCCLVREHSDGDQTSITLKHSCGHTVELDYLRAAMRPDVGPVRMALGKLKCPLCEVPLDLQELIEVLGQSATVALLSSAVHQVNQLQKMKRWDCPECPTNNKLAPRSKRLTFAAALTTLQQNCSSCQRKVCVACMQSVQPDKDRVHSTVQSACVQSRLFVIIQALAYLAKKVGISPDEKCKTTDHTTEDHQKAGELAQPEIHSNFVWGSGIGYGGEGYETGYGVIWDPEEKKNIEEQCDKHVARVLRMIAKATESSALPASVCFLVCSSSLLSPLIRCYLKNDSLEDMWARRVVYTVLFCLLKQLLPSPVVRTHFSRCPSRWSGSIVEMLQQLQQKAERVLRQSTTEEESTLDEETVRLNAFVNESLLSIVLPAKLSPLMSDDHSSSTVAACSTGEQQSKRVTYEDAMRPHQFAEIADLTTSHHFASSIDADGRFSAAKLRRLTRELDSVISESFISSEKTSIFVRVDSRRLDTYKVCITGPRATPYAFGCFVFDIHLPNSFPQDPPMVNLATTDNQTVGFNPNLYNCGYVCLTLLGTWSGSPEEQWQPQFSSLAQVLISIQSFILGTDEPYYNEPGAQSYATESASRSANEYYLAQTLRVAINNQLENPPPEFHDAIVQHFLHCREELVTYYTQMSCNPEELKRFQDLISKQTKN